MLGLGADRLSIYLNDHLAGATLGLELVRRAAGSNRGTSYGEVLDGLTEEIAEDRNTLIEVMELALWQTLRRTHGTDARLHGIDFDELINRARSQRRRLERQRIRAAEDALG
jgi:hypothetical protein